MSTKFYEEIISNYKKLYETKEDYDVKIYVGEKSNIKEFHVHSFILKTQSEFFKKIFNTKDGIEKKDGHFILNLNHSPNVLEILLSYMYCGSFDTTKLQPHELLNLLLTSDEFELQPLVMHIQETLINNHVDFIIKNILEIVELTYQKKSLSKLWDFSIQKICCTTNHLFESTKFLTLNPAILEIILKRDDFYVDEITIWENVLKWACGQQPIIQQDINKWNKNDFTVMERRLNRFIPLIRFYHISSENFLLKIYPFKELLPNDLVNNILSYHMAPNNKLNINIQPLRSLKYVHSHIIKGQHLNIFGKWIDKKETLQYDKIGYIPYRFKLLYRASRDGNTAAAFHKKCDNKGANIVVVKIKNSNQIIGGYNPLEWNSSNTDRATKDSFIFSITNKNDLQSSKIGYSNGNQYSIVCDSHNGPFFGGNDIYINYNVNNATLTRKLIVSSYPKLDLPDNYNYEFDDYEVFQVFRK
ncbi:TLD-domain-containing protein [Glomus cerebriforme]|uniref:TLD-domain-containing protein n=1 Tax=Glomus cerebriforme TaxID=658196 RepID=A0A397SGV7_9GLOM|nr:TLD-domain-containing protein [Glomus cerebriforme]